MKLKTTILLLITYFFSGCSIKYTMEEVPTKESDFLLSKKEIVEKFPLIEAGHPEYSNFAMGGITLADIEPYWGAPTEEKDNWQKIILPYAVANFYMANIVNGPIAIDPIGPLIVANAIVYLAIPELKTLTWEKGNYLIDAEFSAQGPLKKHQRLTHWRWKFNKNGEVNDWLSKERGVFFYHIAYNMKSNNNDEMYDSKQAATSIMTDISFGVRYSLGDKIQLKSSIGYEYSGILFRSSENRLEQFPLSFSVGKYFFDGLITVNSGVQYIYSPQVVKIIRSEENIRLNNGLTSFVELEWNHTKNNSLGFRYRVGELEGPEQYKLNLNSATLVFTSYF